MKIEVIMPQMGESIQEGTVVRWMKKVGDPVKRDEPILEISTDKVDAEIPSPAAGVLSEITVREGQTVEIKTVLGRIETGAGARAAAPEAAPPGPAEPSPSRLATPEAPPARPAGAARPADGAAEKRTRVRSSPLVRRIAREHNIDLTTLSGTGAGGRVTRKDILARIEAGGARPETGTAAAVPSPFFQPGEKVRVEPLSVMRRKISERMLESKKISAHVHSFFEVDFSAVERIRRERKAAFLERHGVNLSYLPFILHSTAEALKEWPLLNASVEGDRLVYRKEINLGIAVALDWGLIVPVIRNAGEKDLASLARAAADLAQRARSKKLLPEEVQGGTFTITNPGVFGSLFGTPIINQPQLAILGVGVIERRLKVVEDSISIRTLGYLSIGFDHRIIDGAVADQFMSRLKANLEEFDPRRV